MELIDIAVREKQPHPRLEGRITGHVRAVLIEELGGQTQNHELDIAVWADTAPGASNADIDMALMLKAAAIIGRIKSRLGDSAA